jgi:hypothetical protein
MPVLMLPAQIRHGLKGLMVQAVFSMRANYLPLLACLQHCVTKLLMA